MGSHERLRGRLGIGRFGFVLALSSLFGLDLSSEGSRCSVSHGTPYLAQAVHEPCANSRCGAYQSVLLLHFQPILRRRASRISSRFPLWMQ